MRLRRARRLVLALTLLGALALGAGHLSPVAAETVQADEDVYAFGDADLHGSTGNLDLLRPIVGMAATPTGNGYWEVATDGGIFAYGDAEFHGSAGNINLNEPVVGMAPTATGDGYWLVAFDGGIFTYGDAQFHGSAGDIDLNEPIVGMAATPTGGGYWLVASDGGIFTYGNAQFHGSAGGLDLERPIVGMAPTPTGNGYWLVAEDGGVFTYGDAQFHGSAAPLNLDKPVMGMAPTLDGGGYWLTARDGGVFTFGNATFHGSAADDNIGKPVVDIADHPTQDGYWLVARNVDVCQNERWRAEYHPNWHTNDGRVDRQCSHFDSQPVRLQAGTEPTDVAYSLDISGADYERASQGGGRCETVEFRHETLVDGRRAVRMQVESTGRCLLPEGVHSYRYVVDVDNGETLIARAVEGGDPDFERSKLALDNTMFSLQIF